MVTKANPVRGTTETSLALLLDKAAKELELLERDGDLFRLEPNDDITYEPDPEYVRATLAATAGSWADLDVDTIIADNYEARRIGSRPPDRP